MGNERRLVWVHKTEKSIFSNGKARFFFPQVFQNNRIYGRGRIGIIDRVLGGFLHRQIQIKVEMALCLADVRKNLAASTRFRPVDR
jgi:hypothetical protein